MRSRSDNSHVEYYTLQELASVLVSQLVLSLYRLFCPLSLSLSLSLSLFLILSSFVTFALCILCGRFDSFDSFAMERENADEPREAPRKRR